MQRKRFLYESFLKESGGKNKKVRFNFSSRCWIFQKFNLINRTFLLYGALSTRFFFFIIKYRYQSRVCVRFSCACANSKKHFSWISFAPLNVNMIYILRFKSARRIFITPRVFSRYGVTAFDFVPFWTNFHACSSDFRSNLMMFREWRQKHE